MSIERTVRKEWAWMRRGLVGLMAGAMLVSCAAKEKTVHAKLDSVTIPQSAVRNQLKAGFCWSYAISGLIESSYKSRTGIEIDLSEESLVYYRVLEEMNYLANAYQSGRMSYNNFVAEVNKTNFQGWVMVISPSDRAEFAMRDGMQLVADYGLVPESVWSFKMETADQRDSFVTALRQQFLDLVQTRGTSEEITQDDLTAILTSPEAFGSAPPTSFEYDGQTVSARQFIADIVGFDPSGYHTVAAATSREVGKLVQLTKRILASGLSVPLSFGVKFDDLKNGVFSFPDYEHSGYDDYSSTAVRQAVKFDGRHAVLATDFVNIGGKEGQIPARQLAVEVNKDPSNLDYIVIKNSWGLKARSNESGTSLRGSVDGFYHLKNDYLKLLGEANYLSILAPQGF